MKSEEYQRHIKPECAQPNERGCEPPQLIRCEGAQEVGFRGERLQRADVLINPAMGLVVGFSRPLAEVVFSA
jgi:hypothetical protein